MKNIILVATHKKYIFLSTSVYKPIQVGSEMANNDFGYLKDNTGINISEKNSTFCELTALYWAWKNDYFKASEFCGLVHYRRYFKGAGECLKGKPILEEKEIIKHLKDYDILLPKKRRYYIETVASHYTNAHYQKDILAVRELIKQQESDYLEAFDTLMQQRSLHLFNMFVMSPEYFNAYMAWLFPLLFALQERIDIEGYDNSQKRVFGYIAERLFNVWLLKNNLRVKELGIQHLESENLFLKAWGVVKRKIIKKRLVH